MSENQFGLPCAHRTLKQQQDQKFYVYAKIKAEYLRNVSFEMIAHQSRKQNLFVFLSFSTFNQKQNHTRIRRKITKLNWKIKTKSTESSRWR